MAELVLTATDTVFHDINLKSGYPDDGGGLLSGKETRSSHRDREMTEEDLTIFRQETNLRIDSDEEWDTDLEDEGDLSLSLSLSLSLLLSIFLFLSLSLCLYVLRQVKSYDN